MSFRSNGRLFRNIKGSKHRDSTLLLDGPPEYLTEKFNSKLHSIYSQCIKYFWKREIFPEVKLKQLIFFVSFFNAILERNHSNNCLFGQVMGQVLTLTGD